MGSGVIPERRGSPGLRARDQLGCVVEDDSREPALDRERKCTRAGRWRACGSVFDGDDGVGRCQFGAPDEVPKTKNRAADEKGLTTSPDRRIARNLVGKGHRRRCVATAALEGRSNRSHV
jgi:hypothetical protein